MTKNFMKTAVAAVCVVAAGMGGLKAYNTANQSKADMLLAENVEALSDKDDVERKRLKWLQYVCSNLADGDATTTCGTQSNGAPSTGDGQSWCTAEGCETTITYHDCFVARQLTKDSFEHVQCPNF